MNEFPKTLDLLNFKCHKCTPEIFQSQECCKPTLKQEIIPTYLPSSSTDMQCTDMTLDLQNDSAKVFKISFNEQ